MVIFKGVSRVISAMPGVGKSTLMKKLAESGVDVVDSDSQKFHFLTNKDGQYTNKKGDVVTNKNERVQNSNFVKDYIAHIEGELKKNDIVFVSAHQEVRDALVEAGVPFDLVRYKKEMKDEVIERIKNRKSDQPNEIIAKIVDENWDRWMEDIDKSGPEHIFVLEPNQFLNDVLKFDSENKEFKVNQEVLSEARERAAKINENTEMAKHIEIKIK